MNCACVICFDQINEDQVIRCTYETCYDMFCKNCLIEYIDTWASDGIFKKKCMSLSCDGEYTDSYIRKYITDKQLLDKIDDITEIDKIKKQSVELYDYQICPFCQKYLFLVAEPKIKFNIFKRFIIEFDVEIKSEPYIKCKKCGLLWCAKCRKKSHGKMTW